MLLNLLSSYPAPHPHLAVLSTLVFVEEKGYAAVLNDAGETAPLPPLN